MDSFIINTHYEIHERLQVFHCSKDTELYGNIHCSEHTVTTPRSGPSSLQPGHWQGVRFQCTALYEVSVPLSIPPAQLWPEVTKPAVPRSSRVLVLLLLLPVLSTVSAVTVVTALDCTTCHTTHVVSTALLVCLCIGEAAVKCDSDLTSHTIHVDFITETIN